LHHPDPEMRDIAQQERTWEAAGHQLAAIAHRESTVRSQLHHFAIVCTKQEQTLQAHRRQCHAGLKHSGDNLGAVHLGLGVVCFIRTPPWQMNHWNGHTVARMNAVSNTMSERFIDEKFEPNVVQTHHIRGFKMLFARSKLQCVCVCACVLFM
jgi:hypothetical protein